MSKAFEDAAFMHGEDARPLRILAEYLEPKQRLRDNRIERAITFWGSARIQAGDDRVVDALCVAQADGEELLAHAQHLLELSAWQQRPPCAHTHGR